jgi:peptidoglycan/xylan/chitin deacetylase (PgdA/CDA1 family)
MNLGQLLESPLATRLIGARQVNVNWDQLAVTGARLLSDAQVWRLFQLAVSDLSIALCMHHVSRRSRDELTIPASELDAFVERAARIEHSGDKPWLTVSFDDGYEDAWHYVVTRARRFPNVEWLMFVCPTKTEHQTGFRWDLDDEDDSARDPRVENRRADLKSVVHLSDAHLATVEQCRYLRLFENAQLGNHTNCHFNAMSLPLAQAVEEIGQSHADFERLFGPERHFAFPFGGRGIDFDDQHVESIRRTSNAVIWSTVARPHLPAHRYPGAVLPRFGVDGRWTAAQIAFWIAMRSLRARAQGLPPLCAEGGPARASLAAR